MWFTTRLDYLHLPFFPFLVNCVKNLDEHDYMEKRIYDGLEIEEVCIPREPIDPCDPHKEHVLDTVDEAKHYNQLTLHVLVDEAVVHCQSE